MGRDGGVRNREEKNYGMSRLSKISCFSHVGSDGEVVMSSGWLDASWAGGRGLSWRSNLGQSTAHRWCLKLEERRGALTVGVARRAPRTEPRTVSSSEVKESGRNGPADQDLPHSSDSPGHPREKSENGEVCHLSPELAGNRALRGKGTHSPP